MQQALREPYRPGSSALHRLDARVKTVMTLLLILGFLSTPERAWPAYPLLWAMVGSLATVAGLGVRRLAWRGSAALPFALAAATLLFTVPGRPLLVVGGLTISDAGAARFAAILIKSWLSAQAALLLALTTPFPDLLWALGSLRVPGILVSIIAFTYRYLFTLYDEAERLLRARESRSAAAEGRRAGGRLIWRAQVAGGMIGNLFLRSYERSERVYAAMLARGYRGQMRVLSPPPLTRQAVLWGSVPVIAVVFIELLAVALWNH